MRFVPHPVAGSGSICQRVGIAPAESARPPARNHPVETAVTIPAPTTRSASSADVAPTLLELEGLSHSWPGRPAPVLADVSLSLARGEVAWIGGRNGVGKTTLLRLAAGILLPQVGSVRIGELTSLARGGRYQRRIGFLSAGDRGLHARMRVVQQLDYWARLAYLPRSDRQAAVAAGIEAFDLSDLAERRVDRLSMGQRQRVRLAMAFLHEPSVVLLDEPRNSLDDEGYELLDAQMRLAAERGGAVLWCSPRGEDLVLGAETRYQLEDGRLERVR